MASGNGPLAAAPPAAAAPPTPFAGAPEVPKGSVMEGTTEYWCTEVRYPIYATNNDIIYIKTIFGIHAFRGRAGVNQGGFRRVYVKARRSGSSQDFADQCQAWQRKHTDVKCGALGLYPGVQPFKMQDMPTIASAPRAPVALDLDQSIQWDDWRLGASKDEFFFDIVLPRGTKAGDKLTFQPSWQFASAEYTLPQDFVWTTRAQPGHYRLTANVSGKVPAGYRKIAGLHINGAPCSDPLYCDQVYVPNRYVEFGALNGLAIIGYGNDASAARATAFAPAPASAPAPAPKPKATDEEGNDEDDVVCTGESSRAERDEAGWKNAIYV